MDIRLEVVKSIIGFLVPEIHSPDLDSDQRDAIEVAIQCLENAYGLEGHRNDRNVANLVDVIRQIVEPKTATVVTDEDKSKAETLKNEGNDEMRAQNFAEALKKYTKAIELNPNNAVYFSNRAAAYSRLNRDEEAVRDCQIAVQLDPTYGKAYCRMGIAFCNLRNYEEARNAYARAVELDPNNVSYHANLRLAEEQVSGGQPLQQQQPTRRLPGPLDFARMINNPNVVNIASQMMNDPSFRNVVSGIMNEESRNPSPNINILFQAGQHIAAQVEATNPALVETLRRSLHPQAPAQAQAAEEGQEATESEDTDEERREGME